MLNSIYFSLMSNTVMMNTDDPLAAIGISLFAGIVIAVSLISKSRTKIKATKSERYISTQLKLTEQSDVYTHTTTSRRQVK